MAEMVSRLNAIAKAGFKVIQHEGYVYLSWESKETHETGDGPLWCMFGGGYTNAYVVEGNLCFATVEEAVVHAELIIAKAAQDTANFNKLAVELLVVLLSIGGVAVIFYLGLFWHFFILAQVVGFVWVAFKMKSIVVAFTTPGPSKPKAKFNTRYAQKPTTSEELIKALPFLVGMFILFCFLIYISL